MEVLPSDVLRYLANYLDRLSLYMFYMSCNYTSVSLRGFNTPKKKRRFDYLAASCGHYHLLKQVKVRHSNIATRKGQLGFLQHWLDDGHRVDVRHLEVAIESRDILTIKWLVANIDKLNVTPKIVGLLIRYDIDRRLVVPDDEEWKTIYERPHPDILIAIAVRESSTDVDFACISYAAARGDIEFLKLCVGHPSFYVTLAGALVRRDKRLIEWLLSVSTYIPTDYVRSACEVGLNILPLLKRNIYVSQRDRDVNDRYFPAKTPLTYLTQDGLVAVAHYLDVTSTYMLSLTCSYVNKALIHVNVPLVRLPLNHLLIKEGHDLMIKRLRRYTNDSDYMFACEIDYLPFIKRKYRRRKHFEKKYAKGISLNSKIANYVLNRSPKLEIR